MPASSHADRCGTSWSKARPVSSSSASRKSYRRCAAAGARRRHAVPPCEPQVGPSPEGNCVGQGFISSRRKWSSPSKRSSSTTPSRTRTAPVTSRKGSREPLQQAGAPRSHAAGREARGPVFRPPAAARSASSHRVACWGSRPAFLEADGGTGIRHQAVAPAGRWQGLAASTPVTTLPIGASSSWASSMTTSSWPVGSCSNARWSISGSRSRNLTQTHARPVARTARAASLSCRSRRAQPRHPRGRRGRSRTGSAHQAIHFGQQAAIGD